VDPLMGLKENVIMGHLIPCGTGARHLRDVVVIDSDAEAEAAASRASQMDSDVQDGGIEFSMPDTGSEASEDNGDNIE